MENGTISSATAFGTGRIRPAGDDADRPLVSFSDAVFEADWSQAIPDQAVQFDRLDGGDIATRVVLA